MMFGNQKKKTTHTYGKKHASDRYGAGVKSKSGAWPLNLKLVNFLTSKITIFVKLKKKKKINQEIKKSKIFQNLLVQTYS